MQEIEESTPWIAGEEEDIRVRGKVQPTVNKEVGEEAGEVQKREGQIREGKGLHSQAYLRTRVSQVRLGVQEHPRLQGQNHGGRSQQTKNGFVKVPKHSWKIINQGGVESHLEKVLSLGGTKIGQHCQHSAVQATRWTLAVNGGDPPVSAQGSHLVLWVCLAAIAIQENADRISRAAGWGESAGEGEQQQVESVGKHSPDYFVVLRYGLWSMINNCIYNITLLPITTINSHSELKFATKYQGIVCKVS